MSCAVRPNGVVLRVHRFTALGLVRWRYSCVHLVGDLTTARQGGDGGQGSGGAAAVLARAVKVRLIVHVTKILSCIDRPVCARAHLSTVVGLIE